MTSRTEVLVKALEPFVDAANAMDESDKRYFYDCTPVPDDHSIYQYRHNDGRLVEILRGHFRRAREALAAFRSAEEAPAENVWRSDIQNAPKQGFFLIRKYDDHYQTELISTGYFERETAIGEIDGYDAEWWDLCDAVKGESLMIDCALEDSGYEWRPMP